MTIFAFHRKWVMVRFLILFIVKPTSVINIRAIIRTRGMCVHICNISVLYIQIWVEWGWCSCSSKHSRWGNLSINPSLLNDSGSDWSSRLERTCEGDVNDAALKLFKFILDCLRLERISSFHNFHKGKISKLN